MTLWRRIFFPSIFFLCIFLGCAATVQCAPGDDSAPSRHSESGTIGQPASGVGGSRLHAHHLVYKGAFAFPDNTDGNDWTYGGHALAHYPKGDPNGPQDGHPGSLYTVGHAWFQRVGEISIPRPLISRDFESLPKASELRPQVDITGGLIDNCTYTDENGIQQDCQYREVAGLEYLHNVNKIVWNLRDWYNVAGYDLDSLGWSNVGMKYAKGVWHIGTRFRSKFHNAKTCDYLFKAPESFAASHLENKWLIAGNHRAAGAFGGSQGPTLYAVAPWQDGEPPSPQAQLDALALVYYPELTACIENSQLCHYPGYRTADVWSGGAWVEAGGRSAILIFGRKGLGPNYYGPGQLDCDPYKGWHSDPYEPQILFYDPADIAMVREGTKKPWQVTPYEVIVPGSVMFGGDCASFNAVTYDAKRGIIYATEPDAGEFGAVAVHVWKVKPDAPAPVVSVTATDRLASEPGDNRGELKISRTGAANSNLTVRFTLEGTGTNGVDYRTIRTRTVIPTGSTSTRIPITPIDDTEAEGNERVVLILKPAADGVYQVGSSGTAAVTIRDNDEAKIR